MARRSRLLPYGPEEITATGQPMTRAATTLTAAVLSYDGIALLETILLSLAAQRGVALGTILVDNGSRDRTPAWLAEHWLEVEVIGLPENFGVTSPRRSKWAPGGDAVVVPAADRVHEARCRDRYSKAAKSSTCAVMPGAVASRASQVMSGAPRASASATNIAS